MTIDTQPSKDQYADRPPSGYTLASTMRPITASDMVFFSGTAQRDAVWAHPTPGQNMIGARVYDHWPNLMALAVKRQ